MGIAALINGTTDIANSSRPIKSSEVEKLKARYNTLGVEIPCAKDGITIFLNEANKVQELSLQQLSDIYQAKITNWKDWEVMMLRSGFMAGKTVPVPMCISRKKW